MGMNMQVLIMVMIVICIASVANAKQGTASFYTEYTPSACYGNENKGVMIAAASDAFWNNGAACGKRYRVTCTGATNQGAQACRGGSVEVTIVDYCPPGCAATIDLSKQAFSRIANPDAGIIKIEYNQV